MFRGIELILKGRDPRDAWAFTQRICGVCTTVHAIASIRAVENAIGAKPPPNARLLRNLIIGAQCVQDHVIHFYHLHALDWVDIVSALSADPAKTVGARAVHLGLAAVERELLRGRARSHQGLRRSRPARTVRERLLGPSGLQAAAGSESDGGRALPRGARLAARVHPHARRARRQEPASAELPRRRHGDAGRSQQSGVAQHGHDRRAQAAHREGARLRRRASTSRTCSPSPASTRTGPGIGRGVGNYLVYGEYPGRRRREARRCSCRAASSADRDLDEGRAVRPDARSPST